ncbi:retrovirus-related pol polyprotein from transposon TNT 1-94 [Tanacetum coccineum]
MVMGNRRLSHLNFDYINMLSKKDVVIGLPKLKYVKDQLCSSCEVSKAKRSSFKSKPVSSSKERLNLLHMDLCGPMRVQSNMGRNILMWQSSQASATRRQLATDPEMCMFALTVSIVEPKNIQEAMADSAWIEAMQEELHQFNRLQVWELVDKPLGLEHNQAKSGIDFEESFALVARLEAVGIFVAYVAHKWNSMILIIQTKLPSTGSSNGLKPSSEKLVENGIIELYFVRTEYQLADMFTKALPKKVSLSVAKLKHKEEDGEAHSAKSDSSPHSHAQTTKTNYNIKIHISYSLSIKDKDSANSEINDKPLEI